MAAPGKEEKEKKKHSNTVSYIALAIALFGAGVAGASVLSSDTTVEDTTNYIDIDTYHSEINTLKEQITILQQEANNHIHPLDENSWEFIHHEHDTTDHTHPFVEHSHEIVHENIIQFDSTTIEQRLDVIENTLVLYCDESCLELIAQDIQLIKQDILNFNGTDYALEEHYHPRQGTSTGYVQRAVTALHDEVEEDLNKIRVNAIESDNNTFDRIFTLNGQVVGLENDVSEILTRITSICADNNLTC